MTELITEAAQFRDACSALRADGARVGFVPTMGALHAGHLGLVDALSTRGCVPTVSIFVNPTQFGDASDLENYPRTLEADVAQCRERGVRFVFAPSVDELYPSGDATRVSVTGLTRGLCGASRPGHFEGVATVVTKFFSLVGPCTAAFGRKDFQQLMVIRRLVKDLLLPVEVVGVSTHREADGLALSSRNQRLSATQRAAALGLVRGLSSAWRDFAAGERRRDSLVRNVRGALQQHGVREDYVSLVDTGDLSEVSDVCGERALLAVAAFAGEVRLIDNVVLGEESDPLAQPGRAR